MTAAKNKINSWILILITSFSVLGCSKGGGGDTPANASHKVVFKAEASAGSLINMVVYGHDVTLTTVSAIKKQSWTSPEMDVPASANVASIIANAAGASASATLKVQVYVDGVLKKEGTSTGTALSATAQHNLK